ncbi:MAG: phosphoenolpyruvate carboxykinase (ATP), partial [Anaerolineales bacterium]
AGLYDDSLGGPYGVGKRISIRYTRAMLTAALEGSLQKVEYTKDPIFGFEVPKSCPDVPSDVLDPASSWPSKKDYMKKYTQLAMRFVDNFKQFEPDCPPDIVKAGPQV